MKIVFQFLIILFGITSSIRAENHNAPKIEKHPLARVDSVKIIENDTFIQNYLAESNLKEASRYMNKNGLIYWEHNFLQKAINYYNRSVKLNKKLGNSSGAAMINNNLGMIYADLLRFEESLASFKSTYLARKYQNEKIGMISSLVNMAVVQNNLELYDDAIQSLQEAIIYSRELNDPQQLRLCYGMVAETYTKKGDSENGMKYFNLYKTFFKFVEEEKVKKVETESRLIKQDLKIAKLEKENQTLLITLQKETIDDQGKTIIKKDSLNSELSQKMTKAQLIIENQNKEIQIKKLLEKEIIAKNRLIKKTESIRNLSIFAAFLLLIIVALLFYSRSRFKLSNEMLSKLNVQVESKNEELFDLIQFKDGLTNMLVHDMKMPITLIENYASYIKPTKQRLAVLHASRQMITLIEDLLDLERYKNSTLPIQRKTINIQAIVNDAVILIQESIEKKNIHLVIQQKHDLDIECDPIIIQRVLINLLSNAIKYSPINEKIIIEIQNHERDLLLSIQDSGRGIPEANKKSIFHLFQNFTPEDTGTFKSTGVGLAFCKLAIDAHRGDISVITPEEGGSKFSICLPNTVINIKGPETIIHLGEKPTLQLSDTDKAFLRPFIGELRTKKMYQISQMKKILNQINDENTSVIEWKNQFNKALLGMNDKEVKNLIHLIEEDIV